MFLSFLCIEFILRSNVNPYKPPHDLGSGWVGHNIPFQPKGYCCHGCGRAIGRVGTACV